MRRSSPAALAALLTCAAAGAPLAQANIGQLSGFGSRSGALAGIGAAGVPDGFASYGNPASLEYSVRQHRRGDGGLAFSWSLVALKPSFLEIRNVVTTNTFTSAQPQVSDVDMNYRTVFGQALGFAYQPSRDSAWAVGLTAYLPIEQLALIDTGEPFIPEYVLYRSRVQRPQIEAAASYRLSEAFQLGAGIHFNYSLNASATILLKTDKKAPSTARITGNLKPKAAPYFGVFFASDGTKEALSGAPRPPSPLVTAGAVVRLPARSEASMALNSGASALSSVVGPLDFNFYASSALVYDPLSVELGASWKALPSLRLYGELGYEAWGAFAPPAVTIENQPSGGIDVNSSANPGFTARNIWVPKVAQELTLGRTTLRCGYSYRPSIRADLPVGAGNYLDPPQNRFTAGIGIDFERFRLDLHAAYYALARQQITKTEGNELGQTHEQKVGAPGYEAGGKIYGGGLSLTMGL